jgi:anaerobic glycerol-3-phosphate dehydrogenase
VFDRLVIGGGVAGVANALELAAAGARVALVRAGPGASALASGGWSGPLSARLGAALAAAGLPHDPAPEPLPHPSGELRAYDFAARSHVAPGLADARVCGIAGLPGFRPDALARLWGCRDSVAIALPGTPAAGWSPTALAAQLDRDPQLLAEALRGAARASAALVLPAVLGLGGGRVHERLQEALAVRIIEALGVPPSVPGWRLDRALLAVLERAGIVRIDGRVVGRDVAGARLRAVHVQTADGVEPVEAMDFVLATGRFTGGGVRAQTLAEPVAVARGAALREAVLVDAALGCAVWVDHLDQRFTTVQPVALTDPVRASAQPLLDAGVHVDAAGRPLDLHGHVHYENLVAMGSVIAGRRHGLGHAAGAPPGANP